VRFLFTPPADHAAGLLTLPWSQPLADWRDHRLLRALAELSIPAVEVVGVAVDRDRGGPVPVDLDAILVTRFLSYATTYRAVFSNPRGLQPTDRLLDALVELLARLHLSGFWGDCSLSNTLFRYDAGTLEAYLVDAETSEQHPELTDGQRRYDVELAAERVSGELMDLQAGDLLPADVDPIENRRAARETLRVATSSTCCLRCPRRLITGWLE
jgi:hypothetical protein